MKHFKRLAAAVVAGAMILQTAAFSGITAFGASTPTTYGGWYETAYATWSDTAATGATVSYSVSGENSYTTVDEELVRQIDSSTGRVDIPGLAAGDYDIKIETSDETTYEATVTVLAEDRSGYAFETRTLATDNYDGESVGAYKADGTPKDDAVIIYVTENNKNTVSYGGYTGIGQILGNARNLSQSTPLIIRFIGEITTTTWSLDSSSNTITEVTKDDDGNTIIPIKYLFQKFTLNTSSDSSTDSTNKKYYGYTFDTDKTITVNGTNDIANESEVIISTTTSSSSTDTFINMCYAKASSSKNQAGFRNITLEGIGTDATISNWGFDFRYGNSVEVKNLTFQNYPEDACSAQYSSRIWIHRCNFYRGLNDCDLTSEQDKYAGDGTTDMNEDYNVTLAYNYYYATKKTSLNGGSDSKKQYDYTYHHNYFYNCGARLPLARYVNVHMYNNYDYMDDNFYSLQENHTYTATAISARASAWIFSEANYYDNGSSKYTNQVFGVATGDSSTGVGFIKSYNDYTNNCTSGKSDSEDNITYTDYIKTASSRSDTYTNSTSQHTSEDTASGGYIDNFDTNSSYFYLDSSGNTDVTYLTDAATAKEYDAAQSGALKDGVTYTALEVDDGYTTIESDKTLSCSNYTDSDITEYFQYSGISYTAGNSYMRFTTDTTFSFKAAAGATITINAKNPSSQKTDSETGDQGTGTERTITLTGTNTNTDGIKITYSPSTDDADAVYADKEYISNSTEEDIYTLTVSNGMNIAYISVTFGDSGSSSGETTTETATETTTVAGVIYDTAQLTFSEVETISEETTLCSYFSITPSMEVVESSATVNGNTYNYLLKSGGDSGTISADNPPTKRAITFTTADAGVIQFCALPASSSNISDRTILIYDTSDYSKTVDTISFDSTAAVMTKICNLPGAGTYCIAFGGGVNIYSINVAVGRSIAADSNGNGYIFTNSSDSYAVTGVTADDAASEDYSKLTVTAVGTDGSGSAETGTVYEYATVDGFVIKPSFLGSDSEGNSYSYLYVVQIEESGGNTDFTYSSKLS